MRRLALVTLALALACTGDDPPPDAGLAVDDYYMIAEGQTLVVDADAGLLINDEGDPAEVRSFLRISAKLGTVVVRGDGGFTYAPLAGFWGHDTFTYTIDDPVAGPSIGTAHIMVLPVTLGLGGVPGSRRGATLDGRAAGDQLGGAVAGLGDINGDGLDDLAVGAPLLNDVLINNGGAYVAFGRGGLRDLTTAAVAAGGVGFTLSGAHDEDRLGAAIAGAGDMNGDGLADFAVCAPREELLDDPTDDHGRCYVIFGRPEFDARLGLAELAAGDGGFAINGDGWQSRAGLALAAGIDVDGDGRGDLAIGAPLFSDVDMDRGRAYVVFGRGPGAPVELADVAAGAGGFALDGLTASEWAGAAVGLLGDINGDGRGELLVGAPFASDGEVDYAGRAYLVYGRGAGALAAPDVVFRADGTLSPEIGWSIQGIGDFNGDGAPDLAIGAPQAKIAPNLREGRSYVVFGAPDLPPEVELGALVDDGRGLILAGEPQLYGNAGLVVAPAGDLDGDGLADLLVGAPTADTDGLRSNGRAYVVFGRATPAHVDLAAIAAGDGGFAIDGELAEARAGAALSAVGDVDGDDILDLLIGAPRAPVAGVDAGRAYVIFGFGPPRAR